MLRKRFVLLMVLCFAVSAVSFAQNQLDPKPLDLENDPDINMFMGCWQNSIPYNTHGSITERAILTKCTGDPLKPTRKGAVLTAVNRFSRAHMDPFVSTTPTTLKGEQEIFYFVSGKGIIKAGNTIAEIRNGIFVLVPEGLEFTITSTSDERLVMYLINEPVPPDFKPKKEILVKDEKAMQYRKQGYLTTHWSHNGKNVFSTKDGLASVKSVNLLIFNAMTIGQPHSHGEGTEEVWTVIEGKNLAFLGKEIRWQPAGTAYKIPPNNLVPHSNINTTEEPILFLYFSRL